MCYTLFSCLTFSLWPAQVIPENSPSLMFLQHCQDYTLCSIAYEVRMPSKRTFERWPKVIFMMPNDAVEHHPEMDNSAKGGLTQIWEHFTEISCGLRDFKR